VLFLNALVSLGRVDARSAAPFNLFVGALQVVIPFYLIATADSADDVLLTSAVFAFGFTYRREHPPSSSWNGAAGTQVLRDARLCPP